MVVGVIGVIAVLAGGLLGLVVGNAHRESFHPTPYIAGIVALAICGVVAGALIA